MNSGYLIRPIEKRDNPLLATIIRTVFEEFKVTKQGTVYTDPTTDHLCELFESPKSKYWVAEENGILFGGCGIYPTEGLPEGCAELVKFYLSSASRGKGIGKELMLKSINTAKEFGYSQLYIESLPEWEKAVEMYKKAGFNYIERPFGKSGHYAATIWMIKNL